MSVSAVSPDLVSKLKSKISARQAGVGIIGLGYVGSPLALLHKEQNFSVTGFDIDPLRDAQA